MLENYLTISFAGVLASINYVGYLAGSIFAVFIKDINAKVKFFRFGMFLAVITTLMLGITTSDTIWIISRILAGFGAAMALVVGSAIVMNKLNIQNKNKSYGEYTFQGLDFLILVSDLIVELYFYFNGTWQLSWIVLAIFAFVMSFYSMYILSYDNEVKQNSVKHHIDKKLFSPF